MTVAQGVCPKCQRTYAHPQRVCPVDGAPLVDGGRLAAAAASSPRSTLRGPAPPPSGVDPKAAGQPPPATPPVPAAAGEKVERLGPYRLVRLLGEGGMARVYLAEHEKISRICAIKRLHEGHFDDEITVARFLDEARAVSDISHPNLVAVYDVVEEPHELYIVMEYLDGIDVAQVLRDEHRFDPRRAAEIAAQACDGLSMVHARDIIHRDLKPENIFLVSDSGGRERVKLLDFGVARLTGDRPKELRTRSGLTVGTPTYMSPEQATASAIDSRSDLYAIGVLLYEMVAGAPPFVGTGYGDVMLMHVNDKPEPLVSRRSDVPAWLDRVVMRCLEKEPSARFQSAVDVARALRAGSGGEVAVPTLSPSRRRRRDSAAPSPRTRARWARRIGVAVGAATVVAILIALALPARYFGRPPPPPLPPVAPKLLVRLAAPPPPPARQSKHVHVLSVPPGAQVTVDGIARCQTPCDAELPAAGQQRTADLELSADGFESQRRTVELAAPPDELKLSLRRRPAKVHRPLVPSSGEPVAPATDSRNGTVDPFK